jgi:exoribonuclease R
MIPGILHVTSKTIYGFTSHKVPLYRFRPLDESLPDTIVGSSVKDKHHNLLVLVDMSSTSRGILLKVFGCCGDMSAEKEALLWKYATSVRWSKKILQPIQEPSFERHILDVPTFNIDPEGCRDIDDCISIWDNKIAITIADVHAWIEVNNWVVPYASKIGQTFYAEKPMLTMLPPELEQKCSLLPGEKRLGLSLIFEWNGTELINPSLQEVVICNKQSFTYENVPHNPLLSQITGSNDPHEWVSELMILYNKYIASHYPVLYRSHQEPDAEKLARYTQILHLPFLAHSSASYTEEPREHWGLNSLYCHATSPIRRWADVVNQGVVKGKSIPYNTTELNNIHKRSKQFSRDTFFLTQLQPRTLNGIILDVNEERSRVYIHEWQRIITLKESGRHVGEKIKIDYFLDMNAPSVKKRFVFKCVDTNCPEPQHLAQSVDEHLSSIPIVEDHTSKLPS